MEERSGLTKEEAAPLLGMTARQASFLLNRMVREGLLIFFGGVYRLGDIVYNPSRCDPAEVRLANLPVPAFDELETQSVECERVKLQTTQENEWSVENGIS